MSQDVNWWNVNGIKNILNSFVLKDVLKKIWGMLDVINIDWLDQLAKNVYGLEQT